MSSRPPSFQRREFLKGFVVTIAASALPACSSDDGETGTLSSKPEDQLRIYPQGIASGDPKPDSIILWTRVAANGSVKLSYEIATDEAFKQIVAKGSSTVTDETDHTLRVKVTGLSAYTQYYYRFKGAGVISPSGRTKTAPTPDQDVMVRFAFASCQDFVGRYYHSWKAFAEQEAAVDFVLFLGDYIYETNGDPDFQASTSDRKIDIPDGVQLLDSDPNVKGAKTLEDYRGLYRQYRSDEFLRQVHALYPFITIWDDHEFSNDCWQDHSTDFNEKKGPEEVPDRRHAASQAWFEYQPADVEFTASASPPDDIKIYRTLRYGKHVELFMTDQRSYRSDHVIPEGATGGQKPEGAPDYLTYSTAFHITQYSEIGSRNFVRKRSTYTDTATGQTYPTGFDELEKLVKPSMLGAEQKAWVVDAIKNSTATWKLWANETQLIQMLIDLTPFPKVPDFFKGIYYFTVDQWDGYRSERGEILAELAGVRNLVALTGDIHAFYAGELHPDFDNPGPAPIGVEYVTAGISSSPVQEITEGAVKKLDPSGGLGLSALVPQFDTLLVQASPHYKYAKSFSHGLAVMEVDGDKEVRVTFRQIADVKTKEFNGQVDLVKFRTASGSNKIELL